MSYSDLFYAAPTNLNPDTTLVDQFGAPLTSKLNIPEWVNPETYTPPDERPITPMPREADEYDQ